MKAIVQDEYGSAAVLKLRDIDFTTPDMQLYPEFDEWLKLSMVEETRRFFGEVPWCKPR